jgi:hypothetical protein
MEPPCSRSYTMTIYSSETSVDLLWTVWHCNRTYYASGQRGFRGRSMFKKLNSVTLVGERTIPTERPPLFDEVSANFCVFRMSRGQRNVFPWPYSRLSRPEPLIFLPSSSSIVLTRLSGPRSRSTTSQKIC